MYSLHLVCRADEVDQLSFALWQAGTVGIREENHFNQHLGDHVMLIAGFEDSVNREALLNEFGSRQPYWRREENIDWVAMTQQAWPGRLVGQRLFLAPVWNSDATPAGRLRVIHNPGVASGTGEHPCTQLALERLEILVQAHSRVADIGTGSGILAAAALRLGACFAAAVDMDVESLHTAGENLMLNGYSPALLAGSADCLAEATADIVVANISGTVLLSIADELLRSGATVRRIDSDGFPESELAILMSTFGEAEVTGINEWRCLTLRT